MIKIQLEKTELLKCLETVSHAVSNKTTFSILESVLIETGFQGSNKAVRFSSTNMDITISTQAESQIEILPCTITVPFVQLKEIVSLSKPDEPIVLTYDPIQLKLKVSSKGSNVNIKCPLSEDFPDIPHYSPGNGVILTDKEFQSVISKTAKFTSDSNNLRVTDGVYFDIDTKGGFLNVFATDSYRFSFCRVRTLSPAFTALIPAKSLLIIAKIVSGDVYIQKKENGTFAKRIAIITDSVQIICNEINGTYVDYRQMIKQYEREFTTNLLVSVDSLRTACKQVAIFAKDGLSVIAGAIVLQVNKTESVALSVEEERGDSMTVLDSSLEGLPLVIAVSYSYVLDFLSVVKTDEVRILMVGPTQFIYLLEPGNDDFLYSMAPIKVNNMPKVNRGLDADEEAF